MKSSCLKLVIVFAAYSVMLNSLAQNQAADTVYIEPLNIKNRPWYFVHPKDQTNGMTELYQDLESTLWVLQSEFGKSVNRDRRNYWDQPVFSSAHWRINRKEWGSVPIDIQLNESGEITIIDSNGKDLLTRKSPIGVKLDNFLRRLFYLSTSFVNSSDGINVRSEPALTGKVITRLTEKSKVVIKERSGKWSNVLKGKDSVKTEWVKVYVNEYVTGYVADIFLVPCYLVHPADIRILSDSISTYAEIELVDSTSFAPRKVKNPFTIDRRNVSLPAPPYGQYDYKKEAFYLPIKNGKDSLYIHGWPGEYGGQNVGFYGTIKVLNQYVITNYGIGFCGFVFYDITTGEKTFSCSSPSISPDGKILIDFRGHDYENCEGWGTYQEYCKISIYKMNDENRYIEKFSCLGQNPTPYNHPNPHYLYFKWDVTSAFWISNNEVILRIAKDLGELVDPEEMKKLKPQYVKLKIK